MTFLGGSNANLYLDGALRLKNHTNRSSLVIPFGEVSLLIIGAFLLFREGKELFGILLPT